MISIRHLKKSYGDATPLRDISVDIKRGEVISIIGASGCGKSTLLRCLDMLERPDSGEIYIDGVNIFAPTSDECALRRKTGMVFQSYNLFRHMSALENVATAPVDLLALSPEQANANAMALLRSVGLGEKANSFPDELSGGQRQRVAIARALAMKPEIMLFDEPTAALDPSMVLEVLAAICSLAREGMTMIIATHKLAFARDVSTRILYLEDGVIYEDGTPEQVLDSPRRERTRRFVRSIRTFEFKISSHDFDCMSLLAGAEEFAKNNFLSRRQTRSLMLVCEELAANVIVPQLGRRFTLTLTLGLDQSDGVLELEAVYGGRELNTIENADELSMKLIRSMVSSISYLRSGDSNIVKLIFKS